MKKTTKKPYRIRNWRDYNQALVNRGSLTIWLEEGMVQVWINQQQTGKRGSSNKYSDTAILCMSTLKEVYSLGLRQSEGLTRSIVQLMAVELDVPNDTTLGRRRRKLEVPLGVAKRAEALHIVVDSTGLKVYGEGEWKVRQHGYSKRRTWRKVHLGVDESSGEIVAAVVTTNDVSDDEALTDVLDQVDGPIEQVSGDGAYDKKKCYQAIAAREARAVIPPRRDAKIWQHGNTKGPPHAREENLRAIRKVGRAAWKRESGYHRRSLAETMKYRVKTIFGAALSARTFESQCAESFIRCAALNTMTRLGMPNSYAVVS